MTQEVNCLPIESEATEELAHCHHVEVLVLPSGWVLKIDAVHVLIEVSSLLLLEEAHQVRLNSLLLVRGDLMDFVGSAAEHATGRMLHDVGAVDGLPLEIAGDFRVQ